MSSTYQMLFPAMWLSWAVYWWWSGLNTKATLRHESLGSRLLQLLPVLVAVPLLWADKVPGAFLNQRFFPWAAWVFWVAACITAAGLIFTVWARVHLGRNWSGWITIKHGHELIVSGPYGVVRHPIYTGLLVAFIGSALAVGQWRGVLVAFVMWAALWRKLRLEERWMVERFGQQYEAYKLRVPALLPFCK